MRGIVWEMIWTVADRFGATFGKGVCCQFVVGFAVLVGESVPCPIENIYSIVVSCYLYSYLLKRFVICQFACWKHHDRGDSHLRGPCSIAGCCKEAQFDHGSSIAIRIFESNPQALTLGWPHLRMVRLDDSLIHASVAFVGLNNNIASLSSVARACNLESWSCWEELVKAPW